uniref:Retrovirus-related pol polyprotein n=1 Tax=Ustilago esculenta TaxID=185366 RepID=A0A481SFS6_9BASI|nr:retrovirus-related pol polyprotein [Ustilago esculenta]
MVTHYQFTPSNSNNGPTFAQEEERVGFPYHTQEERDQGISTPPLEDFICSLSSVAIDNTKGTFTDETCTDEGIPFPASDDEPRTILQAQFKRKGDGTIDKYKARLVAQGYTQVHGINYKETFAPVVKMATLRMLMIMSLQYDMKIYQLNVVTAYLNGELDVNLYMRQPPLPASMMQLGSQSLVCKLNKSLYGLKQAGCTWYQKADSTLTNIGFKRSNYYSALYYIENKGEPPLILTLYVDDVLIFAKHKPTADKFISMLQSKFKMTGGDPVLFILGIQVTSTPTLLHLSQTSHIQHLLTQFGLDNAYIVHTPAIANIAFAVNHLSHYLASPTDKAMTAAKHLLCYLKGTANYGLLFTKKGTSFPPEEDWGPHLQTYSDADFGGDTATRKSTSGIANTINGMPYSWLSKRQPLVVTSTTYAEYITMAEACKEITWSRQLLAELSFEIHKPTPLYVDNQAAIYLSKDPKDHQRNKHINIKYHFVREKQLDGTIIVTNIPTLGQLADSLTKPLKKVKVSQHRQYLNIYLIQDI